MLTSHLALFKATYCTEYRHYGKLYVLSQSMSLQAYCLWCHADISASYLSGIPKKNNMTRLCVSIPARAGKWLFWTDSFLRHLNPCVHKPNSARRRYSYGPLKQHFLFLFLKPVLLRQTSYSIDTTLHFKAQVCVWTFPYCSRILDQRDSCLGLPRLLFFFKRSHVISSERSKLDIPKLYSVVTKTRATKASMCGKQVARWQI